MGLVSAIVPYLLSGITDCSGRPARGLSSWLEAGPFQVYTPIREAAFELAVSDFHRLVSAYAYDVDGFACASFESCHAISRIPNTPKATAWLMLKAYYGAFYAAHSIMRAFGSSVTNIDRHLARSLTETADAYGQAGGVAIQQGAYGLTATAMSSTLAATRAQAGTGGVHEAFWRLFCRQIGDIGTSLLAQYPGATAQDAVRRLDELVGVLTGSGASSGQWLSQIRNRVNYRLQMGCWYPYDLDVRRADGLFRIASQWRAASGSVSLLHGIGRDHERFLAACTFLVALCRELVVELDGRCAGGRSFLAFGALPYLRLTATGSSSSRRVATT